MDTKMTKEEALKFLLDAGYTVKCDEDGKIKEIVNNATGERLQNDGYGDFCSVDEKEFVQFGDDRIRIRQNGLEIIKDEREWGKHYLKILDEETNTEIYISYHFDSYDMVLNNLGYINLYLEKRGKLFDMDGFVLKQGVFDVYIDNGDGVLENIKLENENTQMYLQTIIDYIKGINYVVSNPKINDKLGLISITAQEYINRLVNIKYQYSEKIIEMLEDEKAYFANQIEEIGIKIEECDTAISQLETKSKNM